MKQGTIKIKLLFFCFCFLVEMGYGQLAFTSLPEPLQMIPRDRDNLGHFTLSGTSLNSAIQSLRIVIRLNSDSSEIYDEITSVEETRTFTVKLAIPAALADYNLEIYSIDQTNKQTLEKEVKQLVAGDYFIVTGQSNAAGSIGDYDDARVEDSIYGNKYCRTIGNITNLIEREDSSNTLKKDLKYNFVSCLYKASNGNGGIGIWPMRIIHAIAKEAGVPVCIINGAVGATELSFHLASQTPSNPYQLRDTVNSKYFYPYDRLYRKLHAHNATAGVRGVFWYQGESDATLSKEEAQTYNKRFAHLRESWKLDYPNLEKIFVFQINTGCGGDHMSLIRDQQRKLTKEFDDVIVMPTVGSTEEDRAKDGCHYTDKGYAKVGENIAPVVLKHLYNFKIEDRYILGPSIQRIYYSKKDELCLEFDMDVIAQESQWFSAQDSGIVFLADYFYTQDDVPIHPLKVYAEKNNVYLKTNDSVQYKKLTYLPNIFSNIPTVYMGPWILNKNNEKLGALSFFEFPIEPFPNEFWFKESEHFQAFPNPVTSSLTLRKLVNITLNKVQLYNSLGNLVLNIATDWTEKTFVNLSNFESGIYILRIESNKGSFVKKIILENNNKK